MMQSQSRADDTDNTNNMNDSNAEDSVGNGSVNPNGGAKAALVVRVKRRRSTSITAVPQQLCVIQGSSSGSGLKGLASLSLGNEATKDSASSSLQPRMKRNRSVVLDLVSTVDPAATNTSSSAKSATGTTSIKNGIISDTDI